MSSSFLVAACSLLSFCRSICDCAVSLINAICDCAESLMFCFVVVTWDKKSFFSFAILSNTFCNWLCRFCITKLLWSFIVFFSFVILVNRSFRLPCSTCTNSSTLTSTSAPPWLLSVSISEIHLLILFSERTIFSSMVSNCDPTFVSADVCSTCALERKPKIPIDVINIRTTTAVVR